jgi:peroxiredoxin
VRDWFVAQALIYDFRNYPFTDVEKAYTEFMATCATPYLKDTIQKYYEGISRLKPGNTAPDFSLKNEKGQTVSLSDYKGKVVYLNFWGVGCGPCIYDIKNHVPQLHAHYKNKDVVFLNICVDAKQAEWKEALTKYKLTGENAIAEGWESHPVCQAYHVAGIPRYVLIDKNGKIADHSAPRASELNLEGGKNAIDQLLK